MLIKLIKTKYHYKLNPGPNISTLDMADLIAQGHTLQVHDKWGEDITAEAVEHVARKVYIEHVLDENFSKATTENCVKFIRAKLKPRDTHVTRRFRGGSQD